MQTMSAECVTQVHLFLENPDMQKTVKALAIALCELASMDYSGESTRLLLDAGARVNKPSDGATPLCWAARYGNNVAATKLLLAAGADPNALESTRRACPAAVAIDTAGVLHEGAPLDEADYV